MNELSLESHRSMQQCAGSVVKKPSWRSAKPLHLLWDGWFSDTISRRGPTYVMSSCISPIIIHPYQNRIQVHVQVECITENYIFHDANLVYETYSGTQDYKH